MLNPVSDSPLAVRSVLVRLSGWSMSISSVPTIIAVAFLALAVIVRYRGKAHARDRYPPGPKTLPFLGNIHQLPMEHQPRKLAEWGRQYGDVVFAKFFSSPAIILNSKEAAETFLEKRSANYSDRPRFILLNELMGWDSVVNLMPYGDRFRKHRKWMQDALISKSALTSYHPMLRRETDTLLAGLCDTPERGMDHLRRWAAALVFEVAYAHRPASVDDDLVDLAERTTVETVVAGSPGSMLVDFFPILKNVPQWMPGFGFKRQALSARLLLRQLFDRPYAMVQSAVQAGTARPSLVATLLEESIAKGIMTKDHENDIKAVGASIVAAGSDTTLTAIKTFVLAMVLYPNVMKRAQAEIDHVVGSDRLPEFDDRESLPYVEGVLREIFRWNATVPLGTPHRATENDEYKGYDIPEGAMMMPNIWWMTQNPDLYPDPKRFEPERYLTMPPEELKAKDPRNVVFGFGRRICPGRRFANASIWHAVANVIATIDISPAKDEFGRDIIPEPIFMSGFMSHPKPFKCHFAPRTEKAHALIEQMNAM